MCECQAVDSNYTIRPIVSDGDWGGIDGPTCSALTQTLTVIVNATINRPIPTLSEWGFIAMVGLLGVVSFIAIRKKQLTARGVIAI
jgi:hypothetical protein